MSSYEAAAAACRAISADEPNDPCGLPAGKAGSTALTAGGRESATHLPLADVSFDAAFLFGVLHHIRQWPAAIVEVFRTLKPGGVFAFEEALMGRSRLLANRFWRHVPFGRDELRTALRDTGFGVERFETALAGGWCFVQVRKPA